MVISPLPVSLNGNVNGVRVSGVQWSHDEKRVALITGENKTPVWYHDARRAAEALGISTDGMSLTQLRGMLGIPLKNTNNGTNNASVTFVKQRKFTELERKLLSIDTASALEQLGTQAAQSNASPANITLAVKQHVAAQQGISHANAQKIRDDLVLWVWQVRDKIKKAQEAGNRTKRQASTRMIQAGLRLLDAGLSIEQVKARLCAGWSNDELSKFAPGVSASHAKFKGIVDEGKMLIDAGFENIFFVGPSGCGKTTLASKIAERLSLPFGSMPCSDQLPTSSLYGKMIADGSYVSTSFVRIFEGGGIFLFDELFKLAPDVAVALNMALANGEFYNPAAGRDMKRHKRCIIVGASNSFGTGSSTYTTDQAQDTAFLDRFIGAAVNVDYDTEYELSLARLTKNGNANRS